MPSSPPLAFEVFLVDAAILLIVGLYIRDDVRRGALSGLLDLASLLIALVAALALYAPVATFLVARTELPYPIAKLAAFGLIWLGTDIVFALTFRRALATPVRHAAKSRVWRALGLVTGAVRGGVVAMLGIGVLIALPLPQPVGDAIRASRVGSILSARGEAVQRSVAGVLGDAVQETLSVLTVRPESNERVDLRFTVENPRVDEAAEARMLDLLNGERVKAGLNPLTVDPAIRLVARAYSTTMFQRGFFAHVDPDGSSPFDRMRRGGVSFSAAGENLALAPTVDVAHEGLINSPGHRANILSPRYRRVGIGAVDGGMHGKMFTQNFAD